MIRVSNVSISEVDIDSDKNRSFINFLTQSCHVYVSEYVLYVITGCKLRLRDTKPLVCCCNIQNDTLWSSIQSHITLNISNLSAKFMAKIFFFKSLYLPLYSGPQLELAEPARFLRRYRLRVLGSARYRYSRYFRYLLALQLRLFNYSLRDNNILNNKKNFIL